MFIHKANSATKGIKQHCMTNQISSLMEQRIMPNVATNNLVLVQYFRYTSVEGTPKEEFSYSDVIGIFKE